MDILSIFLFLVLLVGGLMTAAGIGALIQVREEPIAWHATAFFGIPGILLLGSFFIILFERS